MKYTMTSDKLEQTDPVNNFKQLFLSYEGYFYLILLLFSSGIAPIFRKSLTLNNINPYQIFTYCSITSLIVIFLMDKNVCMSTFKINRKTLITMFISAFLGLSLFDLTYNLAINNMTVNQTVVTYYTYPIFIFIAGLLFIKDKKISFYSFIGIAICFIGAYIVFSKGSSLQVSFNSGVFYIFITIICITSYSIICKKYIFNEKQILFSGYLFSSVCGCLILTLNNWWILPRGKDIVLIIFIGLIYNVVCQFSYLKVLKIFSVEKFTTLRYLQPIITSLLAVVILGEKILVFTIIGLLLIIVGNLLVLFKK